MDNSSKQPTIMDPVSYTDPTITAIDAALDDWETSADAMRCIRADPGLPPVMQQLLEHVGITLDPWQRYFLYALYGAVVTRPTDRFTITHVTP